MAAGPGGPVHRRTAAAALAGSVLLLPVGVCAPGAAGAQPSTPSAAPGLVTCPDRRVFTAVVGVPGEAIGSLRNAGAAEVRFRCDPDQVAESLRLPRPHPGDRFGTAIARGPLDDDATEDIAVGIPGLDVDGHRDAGGVAVFRGSRTWLHYVRTLTQASPGVPGTVSTGARFGATLAIEGDPRGRLAVLRVGEPGRTVAGHRDAGGFVDLGYHDGKLNGAREVTLASPGVPGAPATGDLLGAALDGTRAVGAPGRAVNGHPSAGEVLVIAAHPGYDVPSFDPPSVITQATRGIAGTPETGDRFGAALSQDWIAAPGESIGDVPGAGVVDHVGRNELTGLTPPMAVVPGTGGVPGPTVNAHLGAALGELGPVVDESVFREQLVLVGAPGQTVDGHGRAGRLIVVGVQEPDPDGDGVFAFTGIVQVVDPPSPWTNAGFGSSLSELASQQAQVGAPGVAGGRVVVYSTDLGYRIPRPLTRLATWKQAVGTPETGDGFGSALAAPDGPDEK